MKEHTIIKLKNIVPRFEHLRFVEPINWEIKSNQHWAVIGSNSAGKSLLIDILMEKYALHYECKIICQDEIGNPIRIRDVVKSVAFKDIYSLVDTQNSYYQQRWNKGLEEKTSKVKDIVADSDQADLAELVKWFAIEDLMEKEVNLLSSGELRKFLIVSSLLTKPKILILDNPFIGLDAESRVVLNDLFENLIKYKSLQLILIVADPNEVPAFITHVLPIKDRKIEPTQSQSEFVENKEYIKYLFNQEDNYTIDKYLNVENNSSDYEYVVDLKNIHIRYGERTILKNLDWQVKKGEKWALLGRNGSGKSTLLSLICGDNPQAYSNDITLFDRKRGTGESIWDIKKKIGYVSPEMHLYYLKNVRCIDVVGSGFFDTVGLYRKCSKEQEDIAREWLRVFGIEHLENISFLNISTGEQRLLLIARVLVKNPDLLILDEPMHGLDIVNKKKIKQIIEEFCGDDKTLIYVTHHLEELPQIINKQITLTKNT